MLGAKFVLYRRSVLLIRSSSHSNQRRTPTASALSFPALKRLSQKVQIETIQLYKCLNCQGEKSRRVRLCTLLRQPLQAEDEERSSCVLSVEIGYTTVHMNS